MKKNVVQDVIPPKRSIRNIELPSKTRKIKAEEVDDVKPIEKTPERSPERTPEKPTAEKFTRGVYLNRQAPAKAEPVRSQANIPPSYTYDEPKKSRKWLYFSVVILLVAVSFGVSAMFKSAKITVTPKQESKYVNSVFTAKKDSTKNDLGYQIVTISKDVLKTVPADAEKQVDKKAQGTITIYNNYSSTAQKLVATTRFQTPEGLIYRLVNAVTVPGKTTTDGKSVAGSVDAVVSADEVGTKYNVGLKDFTIPGFKGDPKYTTMYARSKTEMTGGFSGMQKVASAADMAGADTELGATLKDSLAKDLVAQIPENFILYKNSISYDLLPISQVDSSAGGAVLRKKGVINAIIFDKGTLSRTIFTKVAPEVVDDMVKITNLDTLDFSLASSTGFNPTTSTSLTFNLKGDATLVWVFDENKLKSDLLGLSKTNAKTVISSYTAIKEAWVETRPFWSQSIPTDPAKVSLITTLAQ